MDDDASARYLAHRLFAGTSYGIIECSGSEAAELARFELPALILLDLTMPVLLLIGGWLARKKLLASEWAWLILGIVYPLSTNITFSLARYVLPLWPGVVWLGLLRGQWKWLAAIWLAVSLALLAWCASIYGSAKWIG